jgi:hypothetical protein
MGAKSLAGRTSVTGFTFTLEQIKSAPPEVRLWLEQEIAAAFRSLATTAPAPAHSPELSACTAEEALGVFETIRHDFAAAQVFLELGREQPVGHAPGLHAFSIGEIKRRLRLEDDRLADCFGVINRSYIQLRKDPEAALFGFDQANHVFVHETTHRSIRSVWEELVRLSAGPEQSPAHAARPAPFGFVPPVVGPSEDIAAH